MKEVYGAFRKVCANEFAVYVGNRAQATASEIWKGDHAVIKAAVGELRTGKIDVIKGAIKKRTI